MEDVKTIRQIAKESYLQSLPRAERKRILKQEKGEWKDITTPKGPNRAMRRKKRAK